MPSPTHRVRSRFRLAAVGVLTAGLLGIPVGCETFRPEPRPNSPSPAAQPATADHPEVVHRGVEPAAAVGQPSPTAPGKHATRRGCYVFYHDFELEKSDPLFAELEALPDQVFGELRLPPSNTIIQVFLFDTQERYERYLRVSPTFRGLPNRRAYFIAQSRVGGGSDELKVFTWMGDHLRTDLRHEITHALLHSALKEVPIWLDEGLAGYFELPPANAGVNPQHLEMLRRGPFQPDLGRLERLGQVRDMEKPEYREAWAWVHLMLRGSPEARKVLLDYLQVLRVNPAPGMLLPRLQEVLPEPPEALADHLASIEMPRLRPRQAGTR